MSIVDSSAADHDTVWSEHLAFTGSPTRHVFPCRGGPVFLLLEPTSAAMDRATCGRGA
jgi:hypothetical protein